MRAAVIDRFGDPSVINVRDVADPKPGPGDVLIEVDACGVNPHDAWVRAGRRSGVAFPRVLGVEPAGIVAATGEAVTGIAVGTRVIVHPHQPCLRCRSCLAGAETACPNGILLGQQVDGGYGELIVVPARCVLPAPPGIGRIEAASVGVAFVTAWHALISRGRLRAGENVLISGATGGLGLAAIQIAALAGARVLATTTQPVADRLVGLGAHVVLDRGADDLADRVRNATRGLGVDVWLDHAAGRGLEHAIEGLAPRGRLVNCGAGEDDIVPINVRRLYPLERELIGAIVGSLDEQQQVLELLGAGRLSPVIADVLPLADAAQAHRHLQRGGHFGKIVLDVRV